MRIIYVTSSLPYGPGETFVASEIKELQRRGHEILVVPMWPRGAVVNEGARGLLPITLARPMISPEIVAGAAILALKRPAIAIRSAACLGRSRNTSIFAKNLLVLSKGIWLSQTAADWGADHIHAHWAATTATMAMVASSISRIPWSLTAHSWDFEENNLLDHKARSAAFVRAINRRAACRVRELAGVPGFQPALIHMGVTNPDNQGQMEAHSNAGPCRVLCPARLVDVKGHSHLIDAMHLLAQKGIDVTLDLAGDGPLRGEIEAQVKRCGVENRTQFLGQLSYSDLLPRVSAREWDIVVLPSIITESGEQEGTPVSLMEAMSCGIPVISTHTGGIAELLENGAGTLVPQKDAAALAAAIQDLAESRERREQQGEAGRRRVEESFSITVVVDELERQFLAAASNK